MSQYTQTNLWSYFCSLWLTHSLSHCDCVLPPLGNKSSLDQLVSHTLGVQSGGVQHSTAVCWLGCADLHNCCFRRMAFRFGSFIIVFLLFVCVIWFLFVAFCERRQSQPLFGHFNTSANRGDSEEEEEEERGWAAKPQNAIRTHASALQAAWAASTFTTFPFFSFSFCELVNWRVVFTSGRLAACVLAYSSHFCCKFICWW